MDQQIIAILATGGSQRAAADAVGVSIRTVKRRCADPEFAARLAAARGSCWEQAVKRLGEHLERAVAQLAELIAPDSKAPALVKLGAARAILETGIRIRESIDFERRLAVLEGSNGEQQLALPAPSP